MSIIQGTAKGGGSTDFYAFPIEDSLRFDGSSYLTRTNSSSVTDESKVTISLWYKIGNRISSLIHLMAVTITVDVQSLQPLLINLGLLFKTLLPLHTKLTQPLLLYSETQVHGIIL
jgi:hypothetical protein